MLRQKEVLDRDETGMVFLCDDNINNNKMQVLDGIPDLEPLYCMGCCKAFRTNDAFLVRPSRRTPTVRVTFFNYPALSSSNSKFYVGLIYGPLFVKGR